MNTLNTVRLVLDANMRSPHGTEITRIIDGLAAVGVVRVLARNEAAPFLAKFNVWVELGAPAGEDPVRWAARAARTLSDLGFNAVPAPRWYFGECSARIDGTNNLCTLERNHDGPHRCSAADVDARGRRES
jgi:hypothetical protein